ncbi:unnamed protein product [Mytilus coruscus]|uniref:C1q domain-containing protein n=1 Tax=Mytilus coruscus TaxID=42192 RepID=A0A6J8DVV1_MYTCO|nr:unnamed protein product [Mytilus coruscus]
MQQQRKLPTKFHLDVKFKVPGSSLVGIGVTKDKRLFLCNWNGSTLFVMSDKGKTLAIIQMDGKQWGIAIDEDKNTAWVTLPNIQSVQVVDIVTTKKGRLIKIPSSDCDVYGIAIIGDEIAVGGYGKIYIISKTGDLMKTLDVRDSNDIYSISVGLKHQLYYAQAETNISSLKSIRLDGTVEPISAEDTVNVIAVQSDKIGNAYFLEYQTANLKLFSFEDKSLKTILTSNDGLHTPYGLAFSKDWSKLFISNHHAAYMLCSNAASDMLDTKETENIRIHRIEVLLANQNERIRTLENIVIIQKTEIQNLRGEVSKLKIKDRIHERKHLRLADILARSGQQMVVTTDVPSGYANDLKMSEIQKQYVTKYNKRLLEGGIITTPVPTIKPTTTAFYAYKSQHEPSPSPHHPLIFDTVVTNENNGYHPFSGIFIVPVNGIYVFTFSIRVDCHSNGPYEIVKNADVVGVVNSDLQQVCLQDHLAGTVVITAQKGDDVFVRTHIGTRHGMIVSDAIGRSSFAGWMISS